MSRRRVFRRSGARMYLYPRVCRRSPPSWWCGVNGFTGRSGRRSSDGGGCHRRTRRDRLLSLRLENAARRRPERSCCTGRKPPDKPPLFRATSVAVGLKIVSLLKRDVDIQYLDVAGAARLPDRQSGRQHQHAAAEDQIAARRQRRRRRFSSWRSDASACRMASSKWKRAAGPHRGQRTESECAPRLRASRRRAIAAKSRSSPCPFTGPTMRPCRLTRHSGHLEKNRIGIESAKLTTGETQVDFSGAIEDLTSPRGKLQYDVRASLGDVARILRSRSWSAARYR